MVNNTIMSVDEEIIKPYMNNKKKAFKHSCTALSGIRAWLTFCDDLKHIKA